MGVLSENHRGSPLKVIGIEGSQGVRQGLGEKLGKETDWRMVLFVVAKSLQFIHLGRYASFETHYLGAVKDTVPGLRGFI